VQPPNFDPFRSRLARDIRNNLAKSFLQALAEKDITVFRRCAAPYLQQDIEPDYARYVTARLVKYEEAAAIIENRRLTEVLPQAAILWELQLYFEMHELLETEWKEAAGDKRRALQGLIRAAGMKIHAENNNEQAAASMGAKALDDLVRYGGALAGFTEREAIVADIRQALGKARNRTGTG